MTIVTRTEFGDIGEVTMTDDLGLRVGLLQFFQQVPERSLLFRRTGIDIVAFVILSTDIADANRMLVVVLDMFAGVQFITAFVDTAILVDHPVVADHGKVAGLVPAVDVIDSDGLTDFRARAVNDNVEHVFHWLHHSSSGVRTSVERKTEQRGFLQSL